jgi:uncharacterized peroxidase-related enzyme
MPRLNVVDPASAEGRAKELLQGPLKDKPLNIFKGLANSGAALDAYVSMSGALSNGELSAKEREAIALALGEANNCDYCTAAHTAIAKQAGMSEGETVAARRGEADDEKMKALITFVLKLRDASGFVEDRDVQAMRDAGYSDGGIAEAVANYALNVFTNYFNHVNETEVDFPKAPAMA